MTEYYRFPVYFANDKFKGLGNILKQFAHHLCDKEPVRKFLERGMNLVIFADKD